MTKRVSIPTTLFLLLTLTTGLALGQTTRKPSDNARPATSEAKRKVAPAAANQPVQGSGTTDRLPKWTGSNGSGFFLGDSIITETKFGNIGIGTTTPASKLTVQGMIETTLGGVKFPDGTLQTTAAVSGTLAIIRDATLTGNGTTAEPLGVAVPLTIMGSVDNGNGVITITNTAAGGPGIFSTGGNANMIVGGGAGMLALGGTGGSDGATTPGGVGIVAFGGSATMGSGGTGGSLIGGVSTAGDGGDGAFAVGALGVGTGNKGGRGIIAIPGGGAGGATPGLAGEFIGDVEITGNLSKGGGSFKIDHPLDPENKYLYHSFVESPDMMNVYNGTITTDDQGEAIVTLPDYFESLNKDFRYQLTVIGQFAQAIVGQKIKGNRFVIKTNAPNVEVSWQVTGIRQDAFANKNRIPVEVLKPEIERGSYLHPEAFQQPVERGVQMMRYREQMERAKARESAESSAQQPTRK